ncbi:MAG: hypothetical protein BZ136_04235 [Methanosphaera sp. rholeuAM74]|nr:MAG: hypothetical protein BZ136_04235 [Methanosphaera sp. rholeuAM74]
MDKQNYYNQLATSTKMDEIHSTFNDDEITIAMIMDKLMLESNQILIIILIAPFLLPASIPGSSTPFGILIILLSLSNILNKPIKLPEQVTNYKLSKQNVDKVFNVLQKALGYVERVSKPRGSLTTNALLIKFNYVITIILAFLLFLPLPIPFTDFIPAVSILVLSLSTLEKDTYLLIIAYIFTIFAIVYFASVGYVGVEIIKMVLSRIFSIFH